MARAEEAALTADIVELATRYGRYGYRRITALLHRAGWVVNMKRVERIWRREGLKVPYRQPKKGRLWLNDGSCIRLRPEYPNHVWSYDFVEDRTHNGRRFRMLNVIDEFTRECLASRVRFELFGRRFTLRLKVVRVVGIEPTLLSEPDFEGSRVYRRRRRCCRPHTFRACPSAPVRPYAAPSSQEEPADVYAIARKHRNAFRRGFHYHHLSFSIASAMKEIENGKDRNYTNSENNPAATVARDGTDGRQHNL